MIALGAYGLYTLQQRRIFSEEQFILLIIVLVPVATFLLSGIGQDRTQQAAEAEHDMR